MKDCQARNTEIADTLVRADDEKYTSHLPLSLLPKARVQAAGLTETIASLELMLAEGWVAQPGEHTQAMTKMKDSYKQVEAMHSKLKTFLDDADASETA